MSLEPPTIDPQFKTVDELRQEFVRLARDPEIQEEEVIDCIEDFCRAIFLEELDIWLMETNSTPSGDAANG
jgi:hypothetical protein